MDGEVRPTASPISRTDGGKPRSRWNCSMTSRISRWRGVRVTSAMGASGAVQVFGTVPPSDRRKANTRSADVRSIWPLTANGRSWLSCGHSEQAFPEHPFTGLDCHTL